MICQRPLLFLANFFGLLEGADIVDVVAISHESAVFTGPTTAEASPGVGSAEGVVSAAGHGFGHSDVSGTIAMPRQDLRR